MNQFSRRFAGPLLLLLIPTMAMMAWARSAPKPATVGFATDNLPDCDLTAYCSSTEYKCPVLVGHDLLDTVVDLFEGIDNTRVVASEGDYVHLTHTSRIWGFTDDIELLLSGSQVQAKSQSRRGPLNFGGNGRRLDQVNEGLHETCMTVLSPPSG